MAGTKEKEAEAKEAEAKEAAAKEAAAKEAAAKEAAAISPDVQEVLNAVEAGERFFVVNGAGTVHEVTEEIFDMRMEQVDFREANAEEIKAYLGVRIQSNKDPQGQIGTRELGAPKRRRRKSKK